MIVNSAPRGDQTVHHPVETCSRCRGIRVHDPVETLFTIAWNTQAARACVVAYLPTCVDAAARSLGWNRSWLCSGCKRGGMPQFASYGTEPQTSAILTAQNEAVPTARAV
jgi:hypothetical protein